MNLRPSRRAQRAVAFSTRWRDPVFRDRMREAQRRGWRERGGYSAERRAADREAAKRRWADPDYRRRCLAAFQRRALARRTLSLSDPLISRPADGL